MSYPTITQYLETLNHVQGLSRTLEGIVPDRDLYGEPLLWVGNFSVIFRVRFQGRTYALKCYIREPNHDPRLFDFLSRPFSKYIIPCRWLSEEVYVYDEYDRGEYYPVVLTEWIEGETLGRHVARLTQQNDRDALGALALRFDRMALWLLSMPFAHGDLKHDNIMVRPDGSLCLIDFDGMYLPQFLGSRTSQIGSPAYQHPARDESYFNERIDDYSLAVISLSLHALQEDPSLFARYNDKENLIFNAAETAVGASELLNRLETQWASRGESALLSLCRMLHTDTPEVEGLDRVLGVLSGVVHPARLSAERIRVPESIAPFAEARKTYPTHEEVSRRVSEPVSESFRFSTLPRKEASGENRNPSLKSVSYEVIDPQEETCAVVRIQGLYGYADLREDRLLLEPIYEAASPFSEGLASVRLNGKCCFIDRQGHCVIDGGEYASADSFREGLARVRRGEMYGFIDVQGNEVIPPCYAFATAFREGLSVVRVGDKYGYINRQGVLVIEAVYDSARHFRAGRAQVVQADRVFCIDKSGCRRPEAVSGEPLRK